MDSNSIQLDYRCSLSDENSPNDSYISKLVLNLVYYLETIRMCGFAMLRKCITDQSYLSAYNFQNIYKHLAATQAPFLSAWCQASNQDDHELTL